MKDMAASKTINGTIIRTTINGEIVPYETFNSYSKDSLEVHFLVSDFDKVADYKKKIGTTFSITVGVDGKEPHFTDNTELTLVETSQGCEDAVWCRLGFGKAEKTNYLVYNNLKRWLSNNVRQYRRLLKKLDRK